MTSACWLWLISSITMTSQWARWRLKSPALQLFLNRLFGRRLKKTSKLRVIGLCAGNSPVTFEFTAQRASNIGKYFNFDDVITDHLQFNRFYAYICSQIWHSFGSRQSLYIHRLLFVILVTTNGFNKYDCSSTSEVTLINMSKSVHTFV